MANSVKKIALEGDLLDKISNLPSNVTNHIFDFLPVDDAARTCVLSRKWRYVWASHPNIKIGYGLLPGKSVLLVAKEFTDIVNKILLYHIGPVLKFSLDFPYDLRKYDLSFVDHWLHYLSRNGIRELTLNCHAKEPYILPSQIFSAPELVILDLANCVFKNMDNVNSSDLSRSRIRELTLNCKAEQPSILPSQIFSAAELVILNLTNCIFNSPNENVDFLKVKSFHFLQIKFQPSQVTSALLNTPQLTFLSFKSCTGVYNLKICAPNLKTLILKGSEDANLIGFEISEVTTLALVGRRGYKGLSLKKLFEKCPLLSSFYVDGDCFENLVAGTQLEVLPLMTSCLKHLVLQQMKWGDLHQVSSILYLLRSSTTLSRLEISGQSYGSKNVANLLSNHLDAAQSTNWTANSLEIVIVDNICKAKEELEFIKFLLSCTPKLKRMFVQRRNFDGDDKANLKLATRLMRFPRASKLSEIMFEPNVKVTQLSSLK